MIQKKFIVPVLAGFLCGAPASADIIAGITALENGEFETAITLFEPDLASADTAFEANWRTGQAYVSAGEPKKAIGFLETATAMRPDHADAHYWLGAANGEMAAKASVFSAASYAKACKNSFERALSLDAAHVEARAGLVEYLISAPGFLGGDKDKALLEAKKIRELDKARGLSEMANVYLAMEKIDSALATFGEAIAEFPHNMEARLGRGMVLRQIRNYDAALQDFDALLNLKPEGQSRPEEAVYIRALGQYFFGAVASQSGQRSEEGIQILEIYLKDAIYDVPVREGFAQYYLAKLYLDNGNVAKAKELVKAAKKHSKNRDLKKLLKQLRKQLKRA